MYYWLMVKGLGVFIECNIFINWNNVVNGLVIKFVLLGLDYVI